MIEESAHRDDCDADHVISEHEMRSQGAGGMSMGVGMGAGGLGVASLVFFHLLTSTITIIFITLPSILTLHAIAHTYTLPLSIICVPFVSGVARNVEVFLYSRMGYVVSSALPQGCIAVDSALYSRYELYKLISQKLRAARIRGGYSWLLNDGVGWLTSEEGGDAITKVKNSRLFSLLSDHLSSLCAGCPPLITTAI
jgi:hypothetical protein